MAGDADVALRWGSRKVTHPSTNPAWRRVTSHLTLKRLVKCQQLIGCFTETGRSLVWRRLLIGCWVSVGEHRQNADTHVCGLPTICPRVFQVWHLSPNSITPTIW